jgi:hypothetical protein
LKKGGFLSGLFGNNNKQESLADFRKAAELSQQQGNTELYNNACDQIKELEG